MKKAFSLQSIFSTVAIAGLVLSISGCELDSDDNSFAGSIQANAGQIQRQQLTNPSYEAYPITLDASGSQGTIIDHNPEKRAGIVAYRWTQTSGPAVTLRNANTARASFDSPTESATYGFSVLVADETGNTDTDSTTVFANITPVAVASNQQSSTVENVCAPIDQDDQGNCI